MEKRVRILGFAGSLRKGSYNKSILNAAVELAPSNVEIEIFDLDGIPLYNADIESKLPERVVEFKKRIKGADAILIAAPEYNFSITGVMKNAIDWATRPSGDNSFNEKPVAVMSASNGNFAGVRVQMHLRQIFMTLNMHPLNKAVMVANAQEKMDTNGRLTDNQTRDRIAILVKELADWAVKLQH